MKKSFYIILIFLRHRFIHIKRSTTTYSLVNGLLKLILFFFICIIIGLLGKVIPIVINSLLNRYDIFSRCIVFLVFYLLLYEFLLAVFQKEPTLLVKPYLICNIRREIISLFLAFLITLSKLTIFSISLGVFIIVNQLHGANGIFTTIKVSYLFIAASFLISLMGHVLKSNKSGRIIIYYAYILLLSSVFIFLIKYPQNIEIVLKNVIAFINAPSILFFITPVVLIVYFFSILQVKVKSILLLEE